MIFLWGLIVIHVGITHGSSLKWETPGRTRLLSLIYVISIVQVRYLCRVWGLQFSVKLMEKDGLTKALILLIQESHLDIRSMKVNNFCAYHSNMSLKMTLTMSTSPILFLILTLISWIFWTSYLMKLIVSNA